MVGGGDPGRIDGDASIDQPIGPSLEPSIELGDLDETVVGGEEPRARSTSPISAAGSKVGRYLVLERIGQRRHGRGLSRRSTPSSTAGSRSRSCCRSGRGSTRGGRARRKRPLAARGPGDGPLSHPNVITVYDVGTVGDAVFVAMEFVDGPHARRSGSGERRRSVRRGRSRCYVAGRARPGRGPRRRPRPPRLQARQRARRADDGRVRVLGLRARPHRSAASRGATASTTPRTAAARRPWRTPAARTSCRRR